MRAVVCLLVLVPQPSAIIAQTLPCSDVSRPFYEIDALPLGRCSRGDDGTRDAERENYRNSFAR
jgi:hypothetical protein